MVRPGPPHRAGLRTGSEGAREEGRRGRPGGLGIRSSPRCPGPPGSRGPAVRSSQAADQMGITRRTRGRSLAPAQPIPAEEGSDPRAANPRASARAGRGLAAGDVGSRRLRLRAGAAHHGLAPGAQVGPLGRPGRPREAVERAPGAGRRLWVRGQGAGAGCRQLAQLAARVAAQSRGVAGRPQPPRRRLPRPRRGRSGRSPIHGQRLWARRASLAPGRRRRRPAGSLRWSASSAGNSRRGRQPRRRRVGRTAGGRRSASGTARPPARGLESAQVGPGRGSVSRIAGKRGALGSSSPPRRPLLPDSLLLPPSRHPSPPSLSSVSPLSPLYAILRD